MKNKQQKPSNNGNGSLPANKYADIRSGSEKTSGSIVKTAYDRAQPQQGSSESESSQAGKPARKAGEEKK